MRERKTFSRTFIARITCQVNFVMNIKKKKGSYPKRLIGDEGKVGGGRLLPYPLPRETGTAQELAVTEAGGEFQGHVIRGFLLLRVPSAGQAHVKAEGGRKQRIEESDVRHRSPISNLG